MPIFVRFKDIDGMKKVKFILLANFAHLQQYDHQERHTKNNVYNIRQSVQTAMTLVSSVSQ